MLWWIFYFCLALLLVGIASARKPTNFPPGPRWLPFFGCTSELTRLSQKLKYQHAVFMELVKQYKSDVIGLKLGSELIVVVSSYDFVRDVLTREECHARPDNFFFRLRCMGQRRGITSTDGELHKIQRNFLVRHLRKLGFGKQPVEVMIQEEISKFISTLTQLNGHQKAGIRVGEALAPTVLNILWTLTTGNRFDENDANLKIMLDLLRERSKAFDMSGGKLCHHPWLRFVAPEWTGYKLILNLNSKLKQFIKETINLHYKQWTNGCETDVIYAFINEMRKYSSSGHSTFTEDQLIMVCLDIFIAGSQSTSNTLDFICMVMIMYPEVQKRVQRDIDALQTSKESPLTMADRKNLPYIEAVLLEVERLYTVTPIIGPRRCLQTIEMGGYVIPKDTTILLSTYSVHTDEKFWQDAKSFKPERFLDADGSINKLLQDRVIAFGLGKRRCLGESVARSCTFMFVVEILNHFNISLAKGYTLTGSTLPGIILCPEYYKAVFLPRYLHK